MLNNWPGKPHFRTVWLQDKHDVTTPWTTTRALFGHTVSRHCFILEWKIKHKFFSVVLVGERHKNQVVVRSSGHCTVLVGVVDGLTCDIERSPLEKQVVEHSSTITIETCLSSKHYDVSIITVDQRILSTKPRKDLRYCTDTCGWTMDRQPFKALCVVHSHHHAAHEIAYLYKLG